MEWFRKWLWDERQISFRFLIDQKPPDPEKAVRARASGGLREGFVPFGKGLRDLRRDNKFCFG